MNKRAKIAEPEARATIVGSCVQLRIDYEQSKQLPIGKSILSDVISAGGHLWRIAFYPHGRTVADKAEYISILLVHISESRSVRARLEVSIMGRDGKPSDIGRICGTFEISEDDSLGWSSQFMKLSDVEKHFLTEGHITFTCTIMVMDDSAIPVPPSDIGTHLGLLLDNTDGTDVSFTVDGEKFPAHRAVLAARSPVFRAELFGSMAEATMSSVTLHDITPATFKAMLRFIYTDELLAEPKPADSSIEMFQNLLAAADRYALDRLKIICAQKLWEKVSVDTVATILACAETHNCHELKNKCIDFFSAEENFKEAIFTDGYAMLVLKFPSITAELKKRVRA
ncbi:BTB/POZ and MATH domain-containing protein 1-like [Lolium rigidum]|uniref:BTB/POZ and MATH domain-containing protein 1-like n=1 Tax=Lolium rigidum TaxID=89674 RepID=UPI001F5DBEA2|nr:BTB/POZ and MATH domain-containing protein 1-like [Lolium rigidum]